MHKEETHEVAAAGLREISPEPVRLYLKHGPQYREGWDNTGLEDFDHDDDPKNGRKCCWKYDPGTVAEIYAEEVLHQVPQGKVVDTLKHWRTLLASDSSTLTVEVLDVEAACKAFLSAPPGHRWAPPAPDGTRRGIVHALVGLQQCGHPCGEFRSLFDAQHLYACLMQAGYVNVRRDPNIPNADRRIRFVAERGELCDNQP